MNIKEFRENCPVMDLVINKAYKANPYDYNNVDDFIQYGIDDALGTALNRELESASEEEINFFDTSMPKFNE